MILSFDFSLLREIEGMNDYIILETNWIFLDPPYLQRLLIGC